MLKEQHIRKVEEALLDAIKFAKIAKMSDDELLSTLKALQSLERTD
jgi:GntR family transcriptional regulator